MPYISAKRVAEIRKELKKEFPEFKMSIRTRNYSTVYVSILSAPINMLSSSERTYESVNPFYIGEYYKDKPEIKEILLRIKEVIDKGNHVVSVDGDYGDIPSFYIDINIGEWDKPFVVDNK